MYVYVYVCIHINTYISQVDIQMHVTHKNQKKCWVDFFFPLFLVEEKEEGTLSTHEATVEYCMYLEKKMYLKKGIKIKVKRGRHFVAS